MIRGGSPPPRLSLVLLASLAPLERATPSTSEVDCAPERLARWSNGWPADLDIGLYWFGPGDALERATGSKSTFYNPTRKTIVYFHGWTGNGDGFLSSCKRITLRCTELICPGKGGALLAEPWLRDEWNVGFFYWDQFSDEACLRDAEQKIWFDHDGNGIRWKSFDVQSGATTFRQYLLGEVMSVADLCAENLRMALGQYAGSDVRFVGHSIGAQLAVRCAALLHHEGHPASPQRLALLEPYFSKHHLWVLRCVGTMEETQLSTEDEVEDFAAVATTDLAEHLTKSRGVLLEVYKSSLLTEVSEFGARNQALDRFGTSVEYEPGWCGGLRAFGGPFEKLSKYDLPHLACMHDAIFSLYFMGYDRPPPAQTVSYPPDKLPASSALVSCPTPAASCSDAALRAWISRQGHIFARQKWTQVTGLDTLDEGDDSFKLEPSIESLDESDPVANRFVQVGIQPRRRRVEGAKDRRAQDGRLLPLVLGVCLLVACFMCWRCRRRTEPVSDAEDSSESERGTEEAQSLMFSARQHGLCSPL